MYCGSSPSARSRPVRRLVAGERGFGMIELLVTMLILNIGILAVVASFNAGIISLNRASRVTTAGVIADQQMELYRALTYTSIRLASATIPGTAPYTTDAAYTCSGCSTQVTIPACSGPPYPDECNASRTVTGADGRSYRMDVYIAQMIPNENQTNEGRPVKRVSLVVRDANNIGRVYVRQASEFDQSTG